MVVVVVVGGGGGEWLGGESWNKKSGSVADNQLCEIGVKQVLKQDPICVLLNFLFMLRI